MKISKKEALFLVLGGIAVLMGNAAYIIGNNPPDGRVAYLLPATSLLVTLYVVAAGFLNGRLFGDYGTRAATAYSIGLALAFALGAHYIQDAFQNVSVFSSPVLSTFSLSPYLVIFGVGSVIYLLTAVSLQKLGKIPSVI